MGILKNAYQEYVRKDHLIEIENLVRTICKDGEVKQKELENLYVEGNKYYFSNEELDLMIEKQLERNRENFLKHTLPNLIRMICKDGEVKQMELENLYVEGNKYYFSNEELDLMIEKQLERNRENFLKHTLPNLIEIATRDTIISANERNLLYSKASVWNISEAEVDTYIEQSLSERVANIENTKYAIETAAGIVSAVAGGVGAVFRGIGKLGNKIIDTHVAKQQAKETNQTSNQQPTVPPIANNTTYLLAIGGQQYGPYSVEQLKAMIPTRQFTDQTLVWKQGMNNWQPANQVQELALLFAPATPPIPQSSDVPPMPPMPPQC